MGSVWRLPFYVLGIRPGEEVIKWASFTLIEEPGHYQKLVSSQASSIIWQAKLTRGSVCLSGVGVLISLVSIPPSAAPSKTLQVWTWDSFPSTGLISSTTRVLRLLEQAADDAVSYKNFGNPTYAGFPSATMHVLSTSSLSENVDSSVLNLRAPISISLLHSSYREEAYVLCRLWFYKEYFLPYLRLEQYCGSCSIPCLGGFPPDTSMRIFAVRYLQPVGKLLLTRSLKGSTSGSRDDEAGMQSWAETLWNNASMNLSKSI